LTVIEEDLKHEALRKNLTQVQIVFCSKSKSELFIGFLPGDLSVAKVIR
jgi:hypothetical protein